MLISPHELVEVVASLTATATCAWAFVYIVRTVGRRIASARSSSPAPQPLPPDFAARWERMEQAVDALSVEVERISEAQRFTTKLLADRTASAPAAPPRRYNSPSGGGVPSA